MPNVQVSVRIEAPEEAVWSELADIAGHVRWMVDAAAIRFATPQRQGVGTVFECDTRLGPLRLTDHMTVTEWRPGRAIGVAHVGLVSGAGRFTVQPGGDGTTTVGWHEQLRFPWWVGGALTGVVAKPVLAAVWRRNLRNLEQVVEALAAAGGRTRAHP